MDRRSLLALAATIPALAAAPAVACSVAVPSPRARELAIQQVRRLFDAWWKRDRQRFNAVFTQTLLSNGLPMDPRRSRELLRNDPLPPDSLAIFDRLFTDRRKVKKTLVIVNTDAGVFVACSESDSVINIQPDCQGMPMQHLFLVTMQGLNARRIAHLASVNSAEPSKINLWSQGTQ